MHLSTAAASGQPFWGALASGGGDVSKAKKAGASWVTVTHAGMFDHKVPASAIGLFPYARANDVVMERGALASEEDFPVFAGVFASDQFDMISRLLEEMREAGFHGVQNFPSVGLADGRFRTFLHEAAMDYEREIEMIRKAGEMDFFRSALVFTPEQAEAMVHAGSDMVVFHPGLTTDGEFRSCTPATQRRFDQVASAARKISSDILIARLAFEWETTPGAFGGDAHGMQYDYNI